MRKLTPFEMETLLRWFIYWMPSVTRRQLAGDYPAIYKVLYPSIEDATLHMHVTNRLRAVEAQKNILPHTLNL